MNLSDSHRRFLTIDQCLVAGVINVVINAGIAWGLLRTHLAIPLWGETSMGVDLLATSILLPFISCLIVSRIIRGQVKNGKLPALEKHQVPARGFHRRPTWLRGLWLALLGLAFAAAPLVALLTLAEANPVPVLSFVAFKGAWAGLLAAALTPALAWWALAEASDAV